MRRKIETNSGKFNSSGHMYSLINTGRCAKVLLLCRVLEATLSGRISVKQLLLSEHRKRNEGPRNEKSKASKRVNRETNLYPRVRGKSTRDKEVGEKKARVTCS